MSECNDKRYRDLIHAWELGLLSDDERREFELHLMECPACFEDVQRFRREAEALRTDASVADRLQSLVRPVKPGRYRRLIPLAVAAAAVIALLIIPWRISFTPTDEVTALENRLLIVPFQDMPGADSSSGWGMAVAALLRTDFEESDYIRVIAGSRLNDARNLLKDSSRTDTSSPAALDIGRHLNARWTLTGSVMASRGQIVVVSQLMDTRSGEILAVQNESSGSDGSIFDLVDRLRISIENSLAIPVASIEEPDRPVADVTTTSEEAYLAYIQGVDLFQQYRIPEAARLFEEAVALDSNFAMAYYYLSRTKDRSLIRRAAALSDRAGRRDRMLIESRLAQVDGDADEAIRLLTLMTGQYPDEKEAFYNLGRLLYYRAEFEDAIEALKRATSIDPLYKPAYNLLTYAYSMTDDFEQAAVAINKYIELAPDEPNPYNTRGDLYARFGMLDQAADAYRQSLTVRPDFHLSLSFLGYMYLYAGDYVRADSCMGALATVDDPMWQSSARLYQVYLPMRKGRYREAIGMLREFISAETAADSVATPSLTYKYGLLASLYEATGNIPEAIATLDRAEEMYAQVFGGSISEFTHYRLYLYGQSGNMAGIEALLLSIEPTVDTDARAYFTYWYGRGTEAFGTGAFDSAAVYFRQSTARLVEKKRTRVLCRQVHVRRRLIARGAPGGSG